MDGLKLGILIDPAILQSLFTGGGAVLAAAIVAGAGFLGYGRQKRADRKYDLVQRRQREYERFITAFSKAGRWKVAVNDAAELTRRWDQQVEQLQGTENEDGYDSAVEMYNYYAKQHREALEKHAEAEAEYHEAHSNLLPIGSDATIQAVNDFHRYFVSPGPSDPSETKIRYAKMLIAMRRDSFEKTKLSVKGVAMNIPWTMGNEDENPINWDEVAEDGGKKV